MLGAVWAPPGPRCSRCSSSERDPGEVGVTSQGSKRGARECLGGASLAWHIPVPMGARGLAVEACRVLVSLAGLAGSG